MRVACSSGRHGDSNGLRAINLLCLFFAARPEKEEEESTFLRRAPISSSKRPSWTLACNALQLTWRTGIVQTLTHGRTDRHTSGVVMGAPSNDPW